MAFIVSNIDSEVTAGLFSLAVALIAFLGVFLTATCTMRSAQRESYNKRVTEERIKWLNTMRSLYGTIMAAWKMKSASVNNYFPPNFDVKFYNEMMFEAEKAKAEFLSRLNTSKYETNQFNFQIKDILERIDFIREVPLNRVEELQKGVELMNVYVNKMLEQEWDRSKEETR